MKNRETPNYAIHCTVQDCKYHQGDENYCSLDSIDVAAHEKNPTDVRCVDCRSFACKNNRGVSC